MDFQTHSLGFISHQDVSVIEMNGIQPQLLHCSIKSHATSEVLKLWLDGNYLLLVLLFLTLGDIGTIEFGTA